MKISFVLLASILGVCICTEDISQDIIDAVNEARKTVIKEMGKEETLDEDEAPPESQRANAHSQDDQIRGTILFETTKILIEKFGIDILPQLEDIDMDEFLPLENSVEIGARKKRQARPCPRESTDCNNPKYRTFRSITGICNNLQHSQRGSAVTRLRRLARRSGYADGIGAIKNQSINGDKLPSTREISNVINNINDGRNVFDLETNNMHMMIGQFLAHDVIFMPASTGLNFERLDCSSCDSSSTSSNCAPIPVPEDDEYFPPRSCIRLVRALNGQKGLGLRSPINQNTHFMDLSSVYGSEECEAASVRSFVGGKLAIFDNGYVLPPQNKNSTNCRSSDPFFCFLAGDFRNSLHPGLIPIHTVMIKEHNKIAKELSEKMGNSNDEEIYQITRKIMIAQWQHAIYNEYLPKLFGRRNTMLRQFDIEPLRTGFYNGYDQDVDASLTLECTTASFRFGHSQARNDFPRVTNANRTLAPPVFLGNNSLHVDSLYDRAAGGTESFLEGMIQCPAWKIDNQFAFAIRNKQFEQRGRPASGVDLIAVNIMRGRDVGLLPYNDYRQLVGFPSRASSFEDLIPDMGETNVNLLRDVYDSVDDIDLYPGLLMEKPMPGALVGRTGLSIIGDTFSHLKRGDRFFYKNRGTATTNGLTIEQLMAIRRTSLAKIICQSSSTMTMVNEDIFDMNSRRVPCATLESLDISPFASTLRGNPGPRTPGTRPPRPNCRPGGRRPCR